MAPVTETREKNPPPEYVVAACVLCAIAGGYLCWNFTLRSDAQLTLRDFSFLLLYECLSLVSYLEALWCFGRISRFKGTEVIVALFFISVFGATVPYVASSVHFWATHSLELGSFVRESAAAWVLYNAGILVFMGVVATVAFLITLARQATRNVLGV